MSGGGWGQREDLGRRIAPVRDVRLVLEPGGWPEADARRAEIDAYFARRQAENPHLWNGRILVLRSWRFAGGVLDGACRETDFAAFMWWRDHGWADLGVVNVFGLAALEGRDGAFLLGVMGAEAATAGRVYFPGGTPDPEDVTADGRVDIAGSVFRELLEETGLSRADAVEDRGFLGIFEGRRIALMRRLVLGESGEDAAARIRAFLAREAQPELADVALVRRGEEIPAAVVPFCVAYMEAVWGGLEA